MSEQRIQVFTGDFDCSVCGCLTNNGICTGCRQGTLLRERAEKAERERDELAEALARDDNWNDKDEAYIAGRTQALAEMRERCAKVVQKPDGSGAAYEESVQPLQDHYAALIRTLPLEPKDGEG